MALARLRHACGTSEVVEALRRYEPVRCRHTAHWQFTTLRNGAYNDTLTGDLQERDCTPGNQATECAYARLQAESALGYARAD
jgi:hypothetical protein